MNSNFKIKFFYIKIFVFEMFDETVAYLNQTISTSDPFAKFEEPEGTGPHVIIVDRSGTQS